MYMEAGPVIETPLWAVTSINEMLLQSWGDTIRVFPAIPENWQDVSFQNLGAEGAFLISAQMKEGELLWVKILSEKGGKLQLKIPEVSKIFIMEQEKLKDNFISLQMNAGQAVLLHQK